MHRRRLITYVLKLTPCERRAHLPPAHPRRHQQSAAHWQGRAARDQAERAVWPRASRVRSALRVDVANRYIDSLWSWSDDLQGTAKEFSYASDGRRNSVR